MSILWLKIVASNHISYNGNCETLVVPTHDGESGIFSHHEVMILATQEDKLRLRIPGEGQWREAVVGRGIIQAVNDRVTMIMNTAEHPGGISAVRTKEALERAEERIRQKQSLKEFRMSQVSMARALTGLKGNHLKEL